MNDNQLDDLKQFISSVSSQTEARLESKIDGLRGEMNRKFDELRTDMNHKVDKLRSDTNDGFAGVSETLEQILQRADKQDVKVNKRLVMLEQRQ